MTAAPDRPRFDMASRLGRARAWLDFLWNDHAFLRLGFQNAHWISDELVRTNQPWPHQLAAWKAKGVRTVINLRGGTDNSSYALEEEACRKLGLAMVTFRVGSREVPSRATVLGLKRLFETVAYPALLHCKSGADRAGLSFLEWVESPAYDPAGLRADFRARPWGSLLTEGLLRRE